MTFSRRSFITGAGAAVSAAAAAQARIQAPALPSVQWRLTSSFPKSLDTIYGGGETHRASASPRSPAASSRSACSARARSCPRSVPPTPCSKARSECTHTASYYFVGKNKTFAFDTTLPFGMNQRQQNAWIYYGGGLRAGARVLPRTTTSSPFPAGNTGVPDGRLVPQGSQDASTDLKGVKIRIAGLGGEVMARLGAVPQQIAGGDIYPALERGAIDGARNGSAPTTTRSSASTRSRRTTTTRAGGKPNSMYSLFVNIKEWEKLPKEYQAAFEAACYEANIDMMAQYDFKNPQALQLAGQERRRSSTRSRPRS